MVMTVAPDLNSGTTSGSNVIDALRNARPIRGSARTPQSKPAKLFWNMTGGNLAQTFKEIANELSICARQLTSAVRRLFASFSCGRNI